MERHFENTKVVKKQTEPQTDGTVADEMPIVSEE